MSFEITTNYFEIIFDNRFKQIALPNYGAIVYFIAPWNLLHTFNVWLTAAAVQRNSRVFPKLNPLANHNWLVLNMQTIMPCALKSGAVSTCRWKQWHSGRWFVPACYWPLLSVKIGFNFYVFLLEHSSFRLQKQNALNNVNIKLARIPWWFISRAN